VPPKLCSKAVRGAPYGGAGYVTIESRAAAPVACVVHINRVYRCGLPGKKCCNDIGQLPRLDDLFGQRQDRALSSRLLSPVPHMAPVPLLEHRGFSRIRHFG